MRRFGALWVSGGHQGVYLIDEEDGGSREPGLPDQHQITLNSFQMFKKTQRSA